MKLQRREFMRRTTLGVGALVLGAPRLAEPAPARAAFDPYALVPLGKTPLKVSRFCLGTGTRGGGGASNHTRMGKEKLESLIRESFDRGTRLFDLADGYGTHPYVIPALKGIPRANYLVVSKIGFPRRPGVDPPSAETTIARFLKELNTDYVDLVLLHAVSSGSWPEELRKPMDQLSEMKRKGHVRALGVSCHSIAALEAAAREPWVESVHARINPFGLSMDGTPEQVVPVLKRIHDAGKAVIGMKIAGEGRLRDDPAKLSESLKYSLTLGCVDVLNIGCESIAEVDDIAGRVRQVQA